MKITTDMIARSENDAFRNALNAIARKVEFYFCDYSFWSDLVYDAAIAAAMQEGDTAYLLVRDGGTSWVPDMQAVREHEAMRLGWRVLVQIQRCKYDTFTVERIRHYRPDGSVVPKAA